jgi:hypothetical protein
MHVQITSDGDSGCRNRRRVIGRRHVLGHAHVIGRCGEVKQEVANRGCDEHHERSERKVA